MNLNELPVEDRELVLALIEIARADCREVSWNELEPALATCWNEADAGRAPRVDWSAIAHHVRDECQRAGGGASQR